MNTPPIVSPQEWEAARERLLVKEKALTRARDALAAERRRMPWLAVEKAYTFDGPKGKARLLDLFEGRRQLIVYRAFFEPGVHGWPEHACVGCSLVADQVARSRPSERARHDPRVRLARTAGRHRAPEGADGLGNPRYTVTDSFDTDFGVGEWHGHNAFIRDGERVFRTYFINGRGDEAMGTTWSYLDMTALGRQETWEDLPEAIPRAHHTSGGTGTIVTSPRCSSESSSNQRRTDHGDRCFVPAEGCIERGWLAAREAFLLKEKAMTIELDELRAERRRLPWVKVEKPYVFEGPEGKCTLADLFQGPQPARCLSLHADAGLRSRMQRVLVRRRSYRCGAAAFW